MSWELDGREAAMKPCPRCGSSEREFGKLGTNWSLRFRADRAPVFSLNKKVRALACLGCGHVELLLEAKAAGDANRSDLEEA